MRRGQEGYFPVIQIGEWWLETKRGDEAKEVKIGDKEIT